MERTEERISELEYRTTELTQSETLKENEGGKNVQSLKVLWFYVKKKSNIHFTRALEEEEKDSRAEKVLKEIMDEKS